jgi:chromosome segregation ATPase
LKETETVTMQTNSLNIPFDFSAAMQHPAVKLQADITRLELENEDLNRQIEELNEYIGELEEKLKNVQLSELPKEPTTFETAKSFLSELVSFGAPLLDKHFELKQQQLEIERMKAQQNRPAVQSNNYQAPEVKKELELQNKVKAWIESKSEDKELYDSLTAIYYNSSSLAKFAELLNNFNNELYEECKRQVG